METSETRERAELVRQALEHLEPHYREVLFLVYIEGASVEQAARTLGLPQGTIKSRLSRGRTALGRAVERMASQRGLVKLAGGELGSLLSTLGTQLGGLDEAESNTG